MGKLTIDDYKRKLAEIKSGSGDSKDYMEWKDGPNIGRVMPGHPNMEGFYEEVKEHKKGEGKDFVAVVCMDDACEICPELEQYRTSKDKEDKAVWKEQQPKPKFYFNFLDKGPDGKLNPPVLRAVGCGSQILSGIMGLLVDEEYGETIIDALEGRDVNVDKGKGKNKQVEYNVKPRTKVGPAMADTDALEAIIGTDATNTKLYDFTEMHNQFDDPHKAYIVWTEGWAALKEEGDADADAKPAAKGKATPKGADKSPLHAVAASKAAATAAKKPVKPAVEEAEEEETPAITSFPKLKSFCATCGESRYKTPTGNLCPSGHAGLPLADGDRPSKPSKAWLKANPAPAVEEEEDADAVVEEEDEEVATPGADDDEDLGDLDSILSQHKKGKK